MKLTAIPGVLPPDFHDAPRATGKSFGSFLAQELENYMKLTPAERIREAVLKRLGMTEEELAAMPPAARQGVEDQIGQMVKQMLAQENKKSPGQCRGS